MLSFGFLEKSLGIASPPHLAYDFQQKCFSCYIVLANSAGTKYHPFQVKIN